MDPHYIPALKFFTNKKTKKVLNALRQQAHGRRGSFIHPQTPRTITHAFYNGGTDGIRTRTAPTNKTTVNLFTKFSIQKRFCLLMFTASIFAHVIQKSVIKIFIGYKFVAQSIFQVNGM